MDQSEKIVTTEEIESSSSVIKETTEKKKNNIVSYIITASIIISSTALVWVFQEDINTFGTYMMTEYGQKQVDVVLFLLTAVSCTPLVLPVWGYALVGVGLGYSIFRLALVMALGSATGSVVTYYIGKYFSNNPWVKKKFPDMLKHPWTHGRSKKYVTWILFIGTASPIPCDVLYAACGAKRYPVFLFYLMMVSGRMIRYTYLGIAFKYFTN